MTVQCSMQYTQVQNSIICPQTLFEFCMSVYCILREKTVIYVVCIFAKAYYFENMLCNN